MLRRTTVKPSIRDRFGFWVETLPYLRWLFLRYDGVAPGGRDRYVNRINGHVVVVERTRT